MKQESRPVFVADDGAVFQTEKEALDHEAEQRRKQNALGRLKVWTVSHGFDSTEGRGYFAQTVIITDADQAALIQWCLDKFGAPLCQWYGDGYYAGWHLHKTDNGVDWALKRKGEVSAYGRSPTKLAVVSKNDFAWADLPKSEFPWPRPKPKKPT